MNNKSAAVIVILFVLIFLLITGVMFLFSKIPFIGKSIAAITAIILLCFTAAVFVIAAKRRK